MTTQTKEPVTRKQVDTAVSPSFVKPLFLGEIHEDLVLPFPRLEMVERQRVNELIDAAWRFTDAHYDPHQAEANGWIGDDIIAGWASVVCWGCTSRRSTVGRGCRKRGMPWCLRSWAASIPRCRWC